MPELIKEYIESLSEQEQIALSIAQDMLGTSYDMEKSIGYNKWLKTRNNKSK
jgi:hypothetical protein|tara:strand:+ start:1081 stop:1236 length:156 start_codon:yes stop_codon:yes gene_type:complete